MAPQYCASCVLPDSRPGVHLDADGRCRGCRNAAAKATIDWEARRAEFAELAAAARRLGRDHDCIVPVSGGKDSFWQTVTCLEHDLRPLCVTYVGPGRTPLGEQNLRRLVELGVDHVELRVDTEVERRFVRRAFERTATSGLVTHMAIYSWPLRVATERGIPLVVYGENSAFEYGSDDDRLVGATVTRAWLDRFGVTAGTTAADWVDDDLTDDDLAPFARPSDDELAAAGVRAVFLGHYFAWDPERSLDVATRHGFRPRAGGPRVGHYDYVNIDDDLIGVHHHPKWHKFGITRSWDTLSMEIRAGRMQRRAAIDRIRVLGAETPWPDIDQFCAFSGLSVDEYFHVLEAHRDRAIWERTVAGWRIPGFLVDDFPWPESPVPARR